jgi:hypothetical protein
MRWNDLKTVIVEASEKDRVTINFESGVRINLNNVPKTVTTLPNFEEKVKAAAQKAKPNETYRSWNIIGDAGTDNPTSGFEPSEEEKLDMNNVTELYKLIYSIFEDVLRKDLKYTALQPGEKEYLPRSVDHEFPAGVSFEYTRGGKKFKIDDIKNKFGISRKINTKNPKKDEFGYIHGEGWPLTVSELDQLKDMIIDALDAKENITTVMPVDPSKDDSGPMRIEIGNKAFYYKNSIVYNTGDN